MKRFNPIITITFILLLSGFSLAADRHEIAFPDLPGYITLKCDLHMHTVFSDGTVWPTVRVDEAWRQGLDAIAISDHIEAQPHRDDIPTKHNRPFELAADQARKMGILLIKGAEITRDTPPGHFNAIFLSDVNPLDTKDFVEVFRRANQQGAFVFWNHQGWKGEEKGAWQEVHSTLYDNKLFHGMEVCNGDGYHPTAHKWCLEKGLTMLGNSDIHQPDLRTKSTPDAHRTMTLVFAKEKSLPAVKEALQQGRTAVWFKNQIIGREALLGPFFAECVKVETPHYRTKDAVWTKVRNLSDLDIVLKRTEELGPPEGKLPEQTTTFTQRRKDTKVIITSELILPARTTTFLQVSTKTPEKPLDLKYVATNFLIAPDKSLNVVLHIPGKTAEAALQLHVAKNGSDRWSGRLTQPNYDKTDGPFASLERARDEVCKIKKSVGLPEGGVEVVIHGGIYELDQTFLLSTDDSGGKNSPIVYRAADNEKVIISGGRDIPSFKQVTDEAFLDRLDPAARGKVVTANLRQLGVSDFGGAGDGGLRLFFGNVPTTLARWPNQGFVEIADVVKTKPFESHRRKGDKVGKLIFTGDRPKRWVNEKDPWVNGYWFVDWHDQPHKIESIDLERSVISIMPPYHKFGYRKGQWYYGMNLLVELDSPGEWYLDREIGMLYFWPPGPINGDNGEKPRSTVSVLDMLVRMDRADYVVFQGITFEAARVGAICSENCNNVTLSDCELRNMGGSSDCARYPPFWGSAVSFSNGTACGVKNCEIYNLGAGGISLDGGKRKTLAAAGHFAVGNRIHDYAQWRRMYSPGISLRGVGNRAANNLIHSAPHIAVFFSGNDHVIELNEIHHVCMESNDAGAIYAGRDWTMRGTVIRHNFLHHLSGFQNRGCSGVYLDDMFCGTEISGNVFYKVARAVLIGGGRDITVRDNIFVDCDLALHIDARGLNWAAPNIDGTMKDRLLAMPYKDSIWASRYPRLVNILDDEPAAPKGNIVEDNLCSGGRWDGVYPAARKQVMLKNNIIEESPGFVDQDKMDFRLKDDSVTLQKLPKLSTIPFGQIGPSKS